MQLSQAIASHRQYLKSFAKATSQAAYSHLYNLMLERFPNREIESLTSEEIFNFLNSITEGRAQATKRLRFQQTKALFNHCIQNLEMTMRNPCGTPMLSQTFRAPKRIQRQLPDKDTINEIIYKTDEPRARLILELGAFCALRIGEILKLRGKDVIGTKLILEQPKSGKEFEHAFMPDKVAERVQGYIRQKGLAPEDRLFDLTYSGARSMMNRINQRFNTKIRLHDLRRYAATFASRSGMPLEIVSKALLRHSDLKITQLYLGKISDTETQRWMDTLYQK